MTGADERNHSRAQAAAAGMTPIEGARMAARESRGLHGDANGSIPPLQAPSSESARRGLGPVPPTVAGRGLGPATATVASAFSSSPHEGVDALPKWPGSARPSIPSIPLSRRVVAGTARPSLDVSSVPIFPGVSRPCKDDACLPFLNVLDFGADPSGNFDSTGAFKLASQVAQGFAKTKPLSWRRIVWVPYGTYSITPGGYDWWGWVEWWGSGLMKTAPTIRPRTPTSGAVVDVVNEIVMRGINIDAAGIAADGIFVNRAYNSSFERVSVVNATRYGFHVAANVGAHFTQCFAERCGTGFRFLNCNSTYCRHIHSIDSDGPGIEIYGNRPAGTVLQAGPPLPTGRGMVLVSGFIVQGWAHKPTSLDPNKGLNPSVVLDAATGTLLEGGYIEASTTSPHVGVDGVVLRNHCATCVVRQVYVAGGTGAVKWLAARAFRIIDSSGCQLLQVGATGDEEFNRVYVNVRDNAGASFQYSRNIVDNWFSSFFDSREAGIAGPTLALRPVYALRGHDPEYQLPQQP